MGSHIRLMLSRDPPWEVNHWVKLTLSRARTERMPPSGSNSARTTGDVPKAREFAACTCKYERNLRMLERLGPWLAMLQLGC